MYPIKKLSNNKIKEITKLHQKKYRDISCLFIAEGEKALEEIIESNTEIIEIYSTKKLDFKNLKNEYNIISEIEMKKISTTASACEILTIAKKKRHDVSELNKKSRLILLDSISDPGNLGTIIRSAAAFNIEGIILYGNCVELYSPKVIRSTAGNFFKIPIIIINSKEELIEKFKDYTKISTDLSQEKNIEIKDISKLSKYIVMFGSEANGLDKQLTSIADKNIILKMKNNVESLNLSVCTSIILYELYNC